jgi:hypothetical protein
LAPSPLAGELEPQTVSAAALAAWQRSPATPTETSDDRSDGRWLWLMVLGLLGVETYMRRSARGAPVIAARPGEVRNVA